MRPAELYSAVGRRESGQNPLGAQAIGLCYVARAERSRRVAVKLSPRDPPPPLRSAPAHRYLPHVSPLRAPGALVLFEPDRECRSQNGPIRRRRISLPARSL